jgi:hypothetical protein
MNIFIRHRSVTGIPLCKFFFVLAAAGLSAGCAASTPPVALQPNQINKLGRVGLIFNALGFTRKYSGPTPVTDPQVHVSGAGYLMNLENNRLDWYESVSALRAAKDPRGGQSQAVRGLNLRRSSL